MNTFCFTGNLGNQAEQRFTPSGDSIVNFSVAVKAGFGEKAVTTWVRCNLWGKRGESVLPYLNKGQLVGVSGELANREYQDKDGKARTSLEVRVNDLTLLGSKQDRSESNDAHTPEKREQKAAPTNGSFDELESDIPFVSNIIYVSDTMGRPKSLKRSKREKGLQGVPGNEGYF
jgi:single-strand DNA-binding protein